MTRYAQRTLIGQPALSNWGKAAAAGGVSYGVATGGIGAATAVTINSVNYEYLTFNSTGNLTVTTEGWFDFVAVGGGGGQRTIPMVGWSAGGGGAGQVVIGSIYLMVGTETVTIGAGSALFANTTFSQAGNTSITATSSQSKYQFAFGNLCSGSHGANGTTLAPSVSVGGAAGGAYGQASAAVAEDTLWGFRGGDSNGNANGGGGGGQSARGSTGIGTAGGAAGAGYDVSAFIGGSELRKAMGGGGGGTVTAGAAATGGVAGVTTTTANNGNANSGGGGGGASGATHTAGTGGSGICYIRYRTS